MEDRPGRTQIAATYPKREEAPLVDQLAGLPFCFDLISPGAKISRNCGFQ